MLAAVSDAFPEVARPTETETISPSAVRATGFLSQLVGAVNTFVWKL